MDKYIQRIEKYFLTSSNGEIYENVIRFVEKELIEKALERSYGNQVMAAKMLGLNRNTLHTKIKKFYIDVRRFKR